MHTNLIGKVEGEDCLEDLDTDGRIILKWVLKKQSTGVLNGFMWIKIRDDGASCEHDN
jgi:hypothetical protein